jgi:hypothetical protein
LNKVILAEDPDVIVSVYGREIIAPGLEKSGKSPIHAEEMTVSENLPIPAQAGHGTLVRLPPTVGPDLWTWSRAAEIQI